MATLPTPIHYFSTELTCEEKNMLDCSKNLAVSIKNGIRKVEGYNRKGEKIVITTNIKTSNIGEGYRSKEVSVCSPLTIKERQKIAHELKETGLTQDEISQKLGVSQKTISRDLSSNK